MATDRDKAMDTWWRYQYLRDKGHLDFMKKAKKCESFFSGLQWKEEDIELLSEQRRPALTINKILPTIAHVAGEQIFNRTEIGFRPRRAGATQATADALTKVFMQIQDNNMLNWRRTDVFLDGVISSRGFYDVRLDYSDNLQGDIRAKVLNPKNVIIDSDATSYDPQDWSDVLHTRWMNLDEIEIIFGKKFANKLMLSGDTILHPYDYDISNIERDGFGDPPDHGGTNHAHLGDSDKMLRSLRVLERQHYKLDTREHFVHIPTGEVRPIPDAFERNDIAEFLAQYPEYSFIERKAPRVRWTVVAGNEVLHDDWSPYRRFTIIPFFPYFRRGTTVGVVENLLGPQELLNKVSSQELHVVNTSANSGWKVKNGSLTNMSIAELQKHGAMTGLVLELNDVNDAEKIVPNAVPTGLDRVSYKAEEHIKSVSGVPDATTGFAREDVSAKALRANQARAASNFALVQDNLNRTDHYLARHMLELVQDFYTEERLVVITKDRLRGETEEITVNQVTPEGEIINDLTIGEYDIVITNQPERDTQEDSTFEQAAAMRQELGVAIPDSVLIQASRLPNKTELVQQIEAEANSEEAQMERQLAMQERQVAIQKESAEAQRAAADAQLKQVKAAQEAGQAQQAIPPETQLRVTADLELGKYKIDTEATVEREKIANSRFVEMQKIRSSERQAAQAAAAAKAAQAGANTGASNDE